MQCCSEAHREGQWSWWWCGANEIDDVCPHFIHFSLTNAMQERHGNDDGDDDQTEIT